MYCPQCGKRNGDSHKFCVNCGYFLKAIPDNNEETGIDYSSNGQAFSIKNQTKEDYSGYYTNHPEKIQYTYEGTSDIRQEASSQTDSNRKSSFYNEDYIREVKDSTQGFSSEKDTAFQLDKQTGKSEIQGYAAAEGKAFQADKREIIGEAYRFSLEEGKSFQANRQADTDRAPGYAAAEGKAFQADKREITDETYGFFPEEGKSFQADIQRGIDAVHGYTVEEGTSFRTENQSGTDETHGYALEEGRTFRAESRGITDDAHSYATEAGTAYRTNRQQSFSAHTYNTERQQSFQGSDNYQRNSRPTTNFPIIDRVIQVVAIILALLNLIPLRTAFVSLGLGLGLLLKPKIISALFYLGGGIFALIGTVLMCASLIFFALTRSRELENTSETFTCVAGAAIVRIIAVLLTGICTNIAYRTAGIWIRLILSKSSLSAILLAILFALFCIALLFFLLAAANDMPFRGMSSQKIWECIRNTPANLERTSKTFKQKNMEQAPAGKKETASYSELRIKPIKEDRNIILIGLFTIITCGIYYLYFCHTLSRDVNIMCKEDGKESAGLIKLILLSIVTCGIYSTYWMYTLLDRIQNKLESYNVPIKSFASMDLGIGYIILSFTGGFFLLCCGLGIIAWIYAAYMLLANLNALSRAYNKYEYGPSQGMDVDGSHQRED